MSEENTGSNPGRPWHLWTVGILTLLWNGSGAITYTMAHLGMLTNISESEAAYFADQDIWFQLLTSVSTYGAFFAGVALLLRSKYAFHLFTLSLTTILITNGYEMMAGVSRALKENGVLVVTLIIFIIACLQLLYAWRMFKKSVIN